MSRPTDQCTFVGCREEVVSGTDLCPKHLYVRSDNSEGDEARLVENARKEFAHRELARRRLLPFVQRIKPDYMAGWFHIDLAARLERFIKRVENRESPRMAISVPPRHGKTELASKGGIAWALGRNPKFKIISATHSDKLAMDNSRDVLDYINDPHYTTVFPGLELKRDSKGASGWRTTSGGSYKPVGVGAGIAGYGADILVIDDPHRDKDAYSATVRQNIYRWYKSSARTRLMPGGGQLLIATRWVLDDLIGVVLDEEGLVEEGGLWEEVRYPAIAEENEYRMPSGIVVRGYISNEDKEKATLLRKKGESLDARRYPKSLLEPNMQDPVVWQALYQQNPTAGDAALFVEESVQKCKLRDIPENTINYTTWDLAIGQTQRNDYTVGVTVGIDEHQNIWLRHIDRGRYDAYDIVEHILDAFVRFNEDLIGIEKNQLEIAIRPHLEKRIDEREINPNITDLPHGNKDKVTRARPIQARCRQGKVFVPTDASWYDVFIKELIEFPAGRNDDMVDALAWIGQMLDNMDHYRKRAEKRTEDRPGMFNGRRNKRRQRAKNRAGAGHMAA